MSSSDPSELPAPLLDAALTQLAADDDPTRDTAFAELIAAHPEHAERLRALALALHGTGDLLAKILVPTAPAEPERIGPYRVQRRLGEGAFGVVYLCSQEAPIRRQVAVKVLRPGAGDRGTLQRFAAEQQLLATFQHAGIASVIDAGTTPDGRPYFAMEYVDGMPITDYCDRQRLTVTERLMLFLELCDGVQHAHARGIVHRDLKPANVLVTECDGKAVPKIIDFGVAKALHGPTEADRAGATATATGRVIGTPGYMSPEQSSGERTVDARADVFSLGVMLYELVAGSLPWARGVATTATEAQRPSTRLHGEPRATAVAAARATEPRLLAGQLRGELDWIVLQSLQPRRELRYQSVKALADDARHHLRDEPVTARPPSAGYRLRKILRRHRAVLGVAAAVALAGLGIAGTYLFRHDALASESARLEAIEDAVEKLVVRAFDPRLQDAPWSDDLRKDTLRDALALHDRARRERSPSSELRGLRVKVLNGLADVHFLLADYPASIELSVEAEGEAEQLLGMPSPAADLPRKRAISQRNLGRCHFLLGHRDQAATWSERAVLAFEKLYSHDAVAHGNLLAKALIERASALDDPKDSDAALAAQRRAIEVLEQQLQHGPGDQQTTRDLVRFHCGLCRMLMERGDTGQAELAVRRAEALADASPRITDEERAIVSGRLAALYRLTGRTRQAVAELSKAVTFTDVVLAQHPGRKLVREHQRDQRTSLAELLYALREGEAADRESDRAIAEAESLGPDYPDAPGRLGDTLARLGRAVGSAQRFERYEIADRWLLRAAGVTASATGPAGKRSHAEAIITRGFVADDLGHPYSIDEWQAAAAAAREWAPRRLCFVLIQLARRCRELGDLEAATAALTDAFAVDGTVPRWLAARETTLLALAMRDPTTAAREARSCVAGDQQWTGLQIAAAALSAAARMARQQPLGIAGTDIEAWDAQAADLFQRLIPALEAAPEASLPARLRELFLAKARLELGMLATEPEQARALSAQGLSALDRARGAIDASWWSEGLWVAGHTAVVRLELANESPDAARAALLPFAAQLIDADSIVVSAGLWAEVAQAAGQARPVAKRLAADAESAALAALRRAIALGFRDRRRLLDDSDLAALRRHPAFGEIVASLPN